MYYKQNNEMLKYVRNCYNSPNCNVIAKVYIEKRANREKLEGQPQNLSEE